MDIPKLKAELLAGHPVTSAYNVDDALAAAELNVENCVVPVESVTGQQIFEAVHQADYAALTAGQLQRFWGIVGMGEVLVNGANTKAALLAMFGSETVTRTNLAALQTETVSRATELGLGFVYPGHVQNARM